MFGICRATGFMHKNQIRFLQTSLFIQTNHFTSGAIAGINGQDSFAAQR